MTTVLSSEYTMSIIFWTILVTPFVYVIINLITFLLDVRKRGKAVDQFPGEPKHWFWGHLHLFRKHGPNEAGLEFMRTRTRMYPYAAGVWVGPFTPKVVLRHPDTIKSIVRTSEPKPLTIGLYRLGRAWIGDGLITTRGKKWARNRRLLTPAFHFDVLKPYTKVNNQAVEILLNKIQSAADKNENFEFFSNISLCAFDVILRCAFSYADDIQEKGNNHPYVQSVCELGDLWIRRAIKPWLYPDIIYYLTSEGRTFKRHCNFVHSISEDVIKKRQKTLEENGVEAMRKGRYIDFLDILLNCRDDEGKGLTFREIRDEVDTFMFAGHDTTSSSMAWTIYSLAKHPEHQQKCQQEIDDILKDRDSDEILWEDLPKLKYLTMCIKESMRLHTPVPFIERITTKEMTIDGLKLPPNSILTIQLYSLHHNPLVWEDPMEFRPERFLPENIEKMDSYAFIPFSAGPRNCIGQNFAMHEQKVILSRIFKRFDITTDPNCKVEKKIGVVMKTKDGMHLTVKTRKT